MHGQTHTQHYSRETQKMRRAIYNQMRWGGGCLIWARPTWWRTERQMSTCEIRLEPELVATRSRRYTIITVSLSDFISHGTNRLLCWLLLNLDQVRGTLLSLYSIREILEKIWDLNCDNQQRIFLLLWCWWSARNKVGNEGRAPKKLLMMCFIIWKHGV